MAVFAIACVPVGRIGERSGLRRMMMLGAWAIFLGSLIVPAVGWLTSSWHVPLLIVSAIIVNIGLAAYFVSGAPYLGALSTVHQRTTIFSIQSALFAIFGFLGSLLGGNLPTLFVRWGYGEINQPLPFQLTLWLVPFILVMPIYLVWRMREVKVRDDEMETVPVKADSASADVALADNFTTAKILILLMAFFGLIRFLQVGGVATMQTFFNVYMDRELNINTATIGTIQALAKLLGVPAALAIPWITRKIGNVATVIGALSIAAFAILPMAWVPVWWVAAAGYIMVWVTTPARYAAFMVFIMARTPARLHGTLNGTQEALAGVSFAVIAFAGGYIIQNLGYSLLFTAGASFMLLGALLLLIYIWRDPKMRLMSQNK
jgi:MFS family permease